MISARPIRVERTDCKFRFKDPSRENNLLEFTSRHWRNQDPAVVLHVERALGNEAADCLADGHRTDAHVLGKAAKRYRAPGQKAAKEDAVAQASVDVFVGRYT